MIQREFLVKENEYFRHGRFIKLDSLRIPFSDLQEKPFIFQLFPPCNVWITPCGSLHFVISSP